MRARHLLVLALLVGACGDDDAPPPNAAQQKAAADKKKKDAEKDKAAKQKTKKMEAVSFIPTLEKVVPPDEAPTIRQLLKDRDFEPDPSGTENRDPWHSYTLPQIVEQAATPTATTAKPSDNCPKNRLVATEYAMRDLSLLGIVTRGTQRYALFRDSKGVGHIVERGKCIGREKGLVTEITDSLVSGVIQPDVLPNGQVPDAVPFTIPLYPTDLTADQGQDEGEDTGDTGATTPIAPPTMTPTAPAPAPSAPPPAATQPTPPPTNP